MQQTLQQQNRFGTGASKLLVNQGGAGAMMNGRMMAGGGMGSSLSSGLEDLKKTAGWSPRQQQLLQLLIQLMLM